MNEHAAPPAPPETRSRLVYLDNLRSTMIVLVVLMHLKVTYSNQGLWYYVEDRRAHPLSQLVFGVYGSFVQAFFMGLLFFVAGAFVPGSCDRRGPARFARDRLIRLGVPTLVYLLLINPLTVRLAATAGHHLPPLLPWYGDYLGSLAFLSGSGPLWFAVALLVFSLGYAGWRALPAARATRQAPHLVPGDRHVLAVVATIAGLAFAVRCLVPAGQPLLNTDPGNFMQLGFFASYLVLFAVGVAAGRLDLLATVPTRLGRRWWRLAWLVGVPAWLVVIGAGGIAANPDAFFGGVHWQSAAYATWEAFFGVACSLGLLVRFRERHDQQGRFGRFLAANAFGVYVFHPPILVAITVALRGVPGDPLLKLLLAAALTLPACFAAVHAIRRVPLMARLFS